MAVIQPPVTHRRHPSANIIPTGDQPHKLHVETSSTDAPRTPSVYKIHSPTFRLDDSSTNNLGIFSARVMAPNGDVLPNINQKTGKITKELLLHRTISEVSYGASDLSSQISETESAKCECCGLLEEFTPNYVKRVREKHCGKMICGLCAAAVSMEKEKNGGKMEAALQAHVTTCARFNKVGRRFPVLGQAEAMREILRRSRAKSLTLGERSDTKWNKGSIISRSSSCIPAITRDFQI